MRFSTLSMVLPALLLAACGSGTGAGNSSAPVAPVKAPAGTNWIETVSKTPEGGYRMGNPDAPIKLVEYGSRTCPVCGLFGREGTQPLEQNYVATGKVSWEFREFLVHGQPDFAPALLGRCAGPGPFFGLLEQMYINQAPFEEKMSSAGGQALFAKMQNAKPLDVAKAWGDYMGFVDFVKARGIPEDKARACLNDQAAFDEIYKVMEDASKNKGVGGTPTFFINGQIVPNVADWKNLELALKAAGA
ncbi:MAG: thioredoxin domain-containing protein [Pseudomonadota bacterium]